MKNEILRYENVHCVQDGKVLINGLFFQAFQSEICGVMVNNMREKNYLIQLILGSLEPDYGWTYFEGNKIVSRAAREMMQNLIGYVGFENGIFAELSVVENIFVASGKTQWTESVAKCCEGSDELLEYLDVTIDVNTKVKDLNPGELKQIELLRCYASGYRLIVLADVGAVMTEKQLRQFFQLVARLKRRGITFIYIAHSSTRLFQFSDHITIVKKGRTIGFMNKENFSRSQIYIQLFGDKGRNGRLKNTIAENKSDEKKVLEFRNFHLRGLEDFNISVNAGEILNIFDRDATDCRNLLQIMKGECEYGDGKVYMNGKEYYFVSETQSIHDGIAFIEAMPVDKMLFLDMTAMDNLLLMLSFRKSGMFARKKYKQMILNLMKDHFTEEELKTKVQLLSDKTKMKLLYCRWILVRPKVLVCSGPFAFIDFGMRQVTVNLIQEAAKAGIAVIILTTQFQEAHIMEGKNITFHDGVIDVEDPIIPKL